MVNSKIIPPLYKDRRTEGNSALRQCQLTQLHLLHVLDNICSRHGVQYFLMWGTLLGAFRHQGAIPWDDDLDIGLTRKEYNRLLNYLETELPEDVVLQTPASVPRIGIPFAKLRDCYSFYGEPRGDHLMSDHSGIFIDIFPVDELPNVGLIFQKKLVKLCSVSWNRMRYFRNKSANGLFSSLFFPWVSLLLGVVYVLVRILIECLCFIFPSRQVCPCLEFGCFHAMDRDWVFPLTQHRYEDGVFPVPRCSELVLEKLYGDWRVLPPVGKRGRHALLISPFQAIGISTSMCYPVTRTI